MYIYAVKFTTISSYYCTVLKNDCYKNCLTRIKRTNDGSSVHLVTNADKTMNTNKNLF